MQDSGQRPTVAFVAAVEKVLSDTCGGTVRVDWDETVPGGNRSLVVRFRVKEGPGNAPPSVILKHVAGNEKRPYDPADTTPFSPASLLFNDWVGAQFLSKVTSDTPVCPRFLGGDRGKGFILLEDLGHGESLADLLQGDDADRAEQGLLALAVTLGRMHEATIGCKGEYDRLREVLGAGAANDPERLDEEGLHRFRQGYTALDLSPPDAIESELKSVLEAMQNPGPFLAFTHGDPCPDNNRYADGMLRLFDFERAGFRHALTDGVYGRVPFPTCWCVNRLPSDITRRMEAVYRAELVKGCPQAADEALFRRALVEACGSWAIRTTSWHLLDALQEDGRWGIATIRQRVLLRLDNFADLADEFGHLSVLGATCRSMAGRLRHRWESEVEEMPLYAAFQRES